MKVTYDIETSSLALDATLWCLFLSIDGGEPLGYSPHHFNDLRPLSDAFTIMSQADELWGWNNLGFDSLILRYQYGVEFPNERDALILAKLIFSSDELFEEDSEDADMPTNLRGSHSLRAFGYRLGDKKLEHSDFSQISEQMLEYCSQDVKLTNKLIYILYNYEYQPNKEVVKLEEDTARIIASQQIYGWNIDMNKTSKLRVELEKKMVKLKKELRDTFKPKYFPDGKVKTPSRPVWIKSGTKVVGEEL